MPTNNPCFNFKVKSIRLSKIQTKILLEKKTLKKLNFQNNFLKVTGITKNVTSVHHYKIRFQRDIGS